MKKLIIGQRQDWSFWDLLKRRSRAVEVTEAQMNHHIHIVGASGYGKTVLLRHFIKHQIAKGGGLLFVDLKGERDLIEEIKDCVTQYGRSADLRVFQLGDSQSNTYSPVLHGTATQIRDRIVESLQWSEEYYKNFAGNFLLKALLGLCWLRDHQNAPFDLQAVRDLSASRTAIEQLCLRIPEDVTEVRHVIEDLVQQMRDPSKMRPGPRL